MKPLSHFLDFDLFGITIICISKKQNKSLISGEKIK